MDSNPTPKHDWSFIARVSNWNTRRFGTGYTFDKGGKTRLIKEEYEELIEAIENFDEQDEETKVHLLKEIFDVAFVAIGMASSLGLRTGIIAQVFNACCDSNDTKSVKRLQPNQKGIKGDSFVPAEAAIKEVIHPTANYSEAVVDDHIASGKNYWKAPIRRTDRRQNEDNNSG